LVAIGVFGHGSDPVEESFSANGALEAVAAEGYRSGALRRGQVGSFLLGLSFFETEAFLKEHLGFLNYGEADLDRDRAEIDGILPR
jgi:hypothetical protein